MEGAGEVIPRLDDICLLVTHQRFPCYRADKAICVGWKGHDRGTIVSTKGEIAVGGGDRTTGLTTWFLSQCCQSGVLSLCSTCVMLAADLPHGGYSCLTAADDFQKGILYGTRLLAVAYPGPNNVVVS